MNTALLRLLQFSSTAFPVGAYTYSQGMEWAVEAAAVNSEASVLAWREACPEFDSARFEAAYLVHITRSWQVEDIKRLVDLDAEFIASRETSEFRAETHANGLFSCPLTRGSRGFPDAAPRFFPQPFFPPAWSCAPAACE